MTLSSAALHPYLADHTVENFRALDSLKEVAAILAQCGISGMPVVDEDSQVVRVVSVGDILLKERGPAERKGKLARLADPYRMEGRLKLEAQTAAEAMTTPAKTIAPWRPVSSAAAQMPDEGVNRLPVVDDEGRLVGIVTRADLVRVFVRPDAEIEREIRDEVLGRALLLETPGSVTVAVEGGKVTLGGTVRMRTDAELAPALVAKVPGVVEVDSSIAWRDDNRKQHSASWYSERGEAPKRQACLARGVLPAGLSEEPPDSRGAVARDR